MYHIFIYGSHFNWYEIYSSIKASKAEYDKSEVVLICLSKTGQKSNNLFLKLANTIIDKSLNHKEKVTRLEKITGMKIQREVKEEIKTMCNVSEGFIREGIELGRQEDLKSLMKNLNMDIESAMDAIGIQEEERIIYRDLLLQ